MESYVFHMSSSALKLTSKHVEPGDNHSVAPADELVLRHSPIYIGGENASDVRSGIIIQALRPIVEPLGYEILHLEIQNNREKVLRVYIDFTNQQTPTAPVGPIGPVGIEDCVAVTRALNEVLGDDEDESDSVQNPPKVLSPEMAEIAFKVNALFSGAYELEVSSPGVDRPLRHSGDFMRFTGRDARVHTFRPLTADEAVNTDYLEKNPKQKNFLGTLLGITDRAVTIELSAQDGVKKSQKSTKPRPVQTLKSVDSPSTDHQITYTGRTIQIPFAVISKANLEPDFNFHPYPQGDKS